MHVLVLHIPLQLVYIASSVCMCSYPIKRFNAYIWHSLAFSSASIKGMAQQHFDDIVFPVYDKINGAISQEL